TGEINDSKSKKKGGRRKFISVWKHVTKGIEITCGRYKATYIYCHFEWAEGKPQKMRQHLGSHCEKYPENIAHIFAKKVANETVILNNEQTSKNNTKRIKIDSNQTNMHQHYDN
ncbi:6520_t:CDS:1, partial [Funneliformis geosporum]